MRKMVLPVAAAFALAACAGNETSPDLAGAWDATRFEFVSPSTGVGVDILSLGATVTILLRADATCRITTTSPGSPADVVEGTWTASTDVLTVRESGSPLEFQFQYALSGTTLTLTGADAEYDFDGDGASEPAKLDVTAVRR